MYEIMRSGLGTRARAGVLFHEKLDTRITFEYCLVVPVTGTSTGMIVMEIYLQSSVAENDRWTGRRARDDDARARARRETIARGVERVEEPFLRRPGARARERGRVRG